MNSHRTLYEIAAKNNVEIPSILGKLSNDPIILNCFEHSCEHEVFPYLDSNERFLQKDNKYWFPIYFDNDSNYVYLINLHPFATSPIYAGRTIYEGQKGELTYYRLRNGCPAEIPLPEDLKVYIPSSKSDRKSLEVVDTNRKKAKIFYKQFLKAVYNYDLYGTSDLIDPVTDLFQLILKNESSN
jgi:hypothetical protein